MVKSFNTRLTEICDKKNSRLCIGLDIDPKRTPRLASMKISKWQEYTQKIINATIDICPVYKLNLAFYECFGSAGYKWMEDVIKTIGNRAIIIADGKRGDIGNTAKKYAESIFGYFGFDAVTLSPYMGRDSILPFIEDETRGAFILCLTSNPSSIDFQFQGSNKYPLYLSVAQVARELNVKDNLGLVVGATKLKQMQQISENSKGLSWLVPGVGAQGGQLKGSLKTSNANGTGIINISRGILYAGDGTINAIKTEAIKYTEEIRELL